jgi:hypothetical protein
MLTCFYLALIIIAGGYIAFSFIVGELVDFGEHAGLDSFGHAIEGIFGGAEGVDADIGEIGLEHEIEGVGPSPFSLRTIAMFAVGFGAGGLIGLGLGLPDPLTLVPASGVGLMTAIPMWLFLRFLYAEQASTSIQPPDYVGLIGRVTVSVPEGKPGQVALIVRGQRMNVPARSEDGSPIRAQAQVQVLSMQEGMVIVKELLGQSKNKQGGN